MQRAGQIDGGKPRRPIQFQQWELLVAVTVLAVCLAMIGWWGVEGFMERLWAALSVAGVCAGIMETHYQIGENLGQLVWWGGLSTAWTP
jgi:hypothetical protein